MCHGTSSKCMINTYSISRKLKRELVIEQYTNNDEQFLLKV